jgi:NAD(P)-dependent dehydrogenase (short-subunit alcohol dehydrogenase family)
MGVDGLRIIITGGAAGIGAGTARLAASRGASVVVSDMNDASGQTLVEEITAAGGRAIYQHCDVTDAGQVQALMAVAAEAFGGIDVLHNNAGIHESMISEGLSLDNMSLETFEKVMNVNVTGVWLCSKYALPYLRDSEQASIINAGSTSSISGYPQCQAYGASKGAVMQLTKMLAVDLAPDSIRVNCYCPGSIHTQIVDKYLEAAPDPQVMLKGMTMTHLVPRMGQPVDVAEVVCFLASPESSFVNGAVWTIDGGSLAWRGTLDVLGMEVGG